MSDESPFPGVRRRTLDSEQATVVEYAFDPGALFPLHHHRQEQITMVQEGSVELVAGGRTELLGAGDWSVTPGGVTHGIRAGERGARFLAVIVPRRAPDELYTITKPEH
jgi:quercetin dioxygenase-like cupin family protein